jgi:rSAM/selenodomain-associated transferase 2
MISTKISIIIPVLNEAKVLTGTLLAMQPLRRAGHELIIADGGSTDASVTLCQPFSDRVIDAPRGRSRQMNAGARVASGSIFLFLHADTLLPEGADQLILAGMKEHKMNWGRFDVHLSGKHPLLRIVEELMNWRSRISGIATGDQAIFVRREIFGAAGGFPDIDLMEDIILSKSLKKYGSPLCLRQYVTTSSRRWEKKGILRTVLFMWFLRLAHFLGVDPRRLAQLYEMPK